MNPPPIRPRRSQRNTGLWITVIVLGVMLLLALIALVGVLSVSSLDSSELYANRPEDEFPVLMERASYGRGEVKVVRIPLQGIIMRRSESGLFGNRIDRIENLMHQIRAATNDEDVRAIILEVDSPGGAITPSDEIYTALRRFKESADDRIVVAFTRDLAASGGYYAAMAADWIVAEPTSIIGSIGVIIQAFNWKQLTDDIGIHDVTITSGNNKDMLNPFQDVNPEHVDMLQEMIDTMHSRFKGIVQQSRHLDTSTVDELADGRIFSAEKAIDYDLIDQIGYWDDVVDRTAEMLGVPSVRIIRYTRQTDLFTMLAQLRVPVQVEAQLPVQQPRFMYLWHP